MNYYNFAFSNRILFSNLMFLIFRILRIKLKLLIIAPLRWWFSRLTPAGTTHASTPALLWSDRTRSGSGQAGAASLLPTPLYSTQLPFYAFYLTLSRGV